MKIIGFSHIDGHPEMVMRSDSSLLNNHKPFFLPIGTADVRMVRAIVLRVSRLGKSIAPRFAQRYYDAWAPALSMRAADLLDQARREGKSWTTAMCFDYSLVVGNYQPIQEGTPLPCDSLSLPVDEAIAEISRLMTIRQGDLIYIEYAQEPEIIQAEQIITGPAGYDDQLYCKIK